MCILFHHIECCWLGTTGPLAQWIEGSILHSFCLLSATLRTLSNTAFCRYCKLVDSRTPCIKAPVRRSRCRGLQFESVGVVRNLLFWTFGFLRLRNVFGNTVAGVRPLGYFTK